jgi:hypothetical protein
MKQALLWKESLMVILVAVLIIIFATLIQIVLEDIFK